MPFKMRDKAFKEMLIITANPDVLSRNAVGEFVLEGEPAVRSNLYEIFKAAFLYFLEPNLFLFNRFLSGFEL